MAPGVGAAGHRGPLQDRCRVRRGGGPAGGEAVLRAVRPSELESGCPKGPW